MSDNDVELLEGTELQRPPTPLSIIITIVSMIAAVGVLACGALWWVWRSL